MLKKALCFCLLSMLFAGCGERVFMLKDLASSQKQMGKYIARQEKGFQRLKRDIQRNRLQKSISIDIVNRRYGEPVFCDSQKIPAEIGIAQSCLYRAPTEYFSADKVYLYFDRQESLLSWKYEPAE